MSDGESSDGEVDFRPTIDISTLPTVVQGRIKAMKNLQLETVKAECAYYKEVHQLDIKYQKMFDVINNKRGAILSGAYEPSGAELEWSDAAPPSDEEAVTNGVGKIKLDMDENTKGIPKFWMYTLKNVNEESLQALIEPHDEPVLEYLNDITVQINEPNNSGFTLKFHFGENPFFTNQVLTKVYSLREDPDPKCPLEYDGPEIIGCKGCSIDWKEGKDVTKTTVTVKNLRSKKANKCCPEKDVTKEVSADSFFSFFSPPDITDENEDDASDEERAILAMDFDVGFNIKEKIIPRAVLYFTGEALDDDDDEFEDCDTEEESEDGDH